MPCLQEQDANKVAGRYGAQKLPVVLFEMQKGNANRCKATEYIRYSDGIRRQGIHICYDLVGFIPVDTLRKQETA